MSDDLRSLLAEFPDWLLLLAAYANREQEAAAAPVATTPSPEGAEDEEGPDGRGWTPRLRSVTSLRDEHLAPLHGKLIAHGLLQFNLGGRDSGVLYRLSGEARRAVHELAREHLAEAASQDPQERHVQAA